MRIVFMGTPDFSLDSLRALHAGGHDVVAAVTQPDRPKGRGGALQPPPVKQLALELGIPVIQSEKVNAEAAAIASLKPDCIVTAAFGQILSREILALPRLGCVNVHASLLPELRGAAPIQRALIRGDTTTGITTMLMDAGMDTGDILLQREVAIEPEADAGALSGALARVGAELLLETLKGLEECMITPRPQEHSRVTFAPSLKKEDGRIKWGVGARSIVNLARGCSPWPSAWTFHRGTMIKIWKARADGGAQNAPPGAIVSAGEDGILVAAGEGAVLITELQREGGKRMKAGDFLRGYGLREGEMMEENK